MRLNRYRLRALARPARRWITGLALSAVTFALAHGAVGRAEAARARWGTTRTVLVARRDLGAGEPLDPAALRTEDRPLALVAADSLDAIDAAGVAGSTLAWPVLAGDVLRRGQLRAPGRQLPAGRRAVAVPRPSGLDPRAGDRVDVVDGTQGTVAAAGATVLRVDADAVVLAVDQADVGAVARALTTGRTLVVLTGDG